MPNSFPSVSRPVRLEMSPIVINSEPNEIMDILRDFNTEPSLWGQTGFHCFASPIGPLPKDATLHLSKDPTDAIEPVAGIRLFVSEIVFKLFKLLSIVSIFAALISESQQPSMMNCDNIRAVAMNIIYIREVWKYRT